MVISVYKIGINLSKQIFQFNIKLKYRFKI